MTTIQNTTEINKNVSEVYVFLADLNNHEQLMPENIYNWSSTTDEARFTIQNMAKLALKVEERSENQFIKLVPSEKAPFEVALRWELQVVADTVTKATFIIDADLNMMMKMIASGPLQKLVDFQVNKLKEKLG
ncbi:orotate phosphoribosyltransferase [Sphingobacterium siyangense]|uniref:Orotate phosphoribosyltransferase n=1 Tax=Sphingobacterium siyangense TaxID=459529 RepID=A0A420GAT3_9SPHI|nr:SRPBCC family protein [Sphingobacterium siyangense]QRY60128.1 SRPBCC family protein [Sphingobacterium siyangense]RKF42266.1 orotate phosphoribosyltransferase [Sphingobacterium siyangense]